MHVEIMELALETLRTIADLLRYKIGQASLLTHPDFAVLKGLETYLDALQLRFRLNFSTHVLLF